LATFPQPASDTAFVEPQQWLGDCHPLVEQLGSAGCLVTPDMAAITLRLGPVRDLAGLREFLRAYHAELLLPLELPAIHRAWDHATRNEFRELATFDCALKGEARLLPFALASQTAGQRQLRRFRPLQDVRLVQRYLAATERAEVQAWHTLVYGVTMWLFSLPLHQGLLSYARQVTRGFIRAAADDVGFSARQGGELFQEFSSKLATDVSGVVARATKS
jgi:urease accessory protein UreF